MSDYLLSPIRLNELEVLIEHSVQRAIQHNSQKSNELEQLDNPLNINEVAQLTGYTKPTLYLYCQKNIVPHHKKNGRLFFFKSEILDWIRTGKQKTLKEIEAETDELLANHKNGLK